MNEKRIAVPLGAEMRAMNGVRRPAALTHALLVAAFAMGICNVAAQSVMPGDSLSCPNLFPEGLAVVEAMQYAGSGSPISSDAAGASCWIDLATVSAKGATQPTWIDVRAAADARAAPIPGALAIPLAELRTKAFLQGTPIVLIGSGRDDADVARACGELRRGGFRQVQSLRGGIRSWVSDRRPILAAATVLQELDLISPAEFHRQAAGAPWRVLGIDLEATEAPPAAMAALERVEAGNDAVRAMAAIRQRQMQMGRLSVIERPTATVIVTRDDASATRLREAMRGGEYRDVLVLQGGLAAYRSFLVQQQGIAAAAGRPLVRSCGSG